MEFKNVITFLFGLCFGFLSLTMVNRVNHYRVTPSFNIETQSQPVSTIGTGKKGEKSFYFVAASPSLKSAMVANGAATATDFKILCLVIAKHAARSVTAVLETWAKHCDKVVVFSTFAKTYSSQSKVEIVPVDHAAKTAWQQAQYAYRFVETAYGQQYQWFVKVEDDSFVVMENLHQMLAAYQDGVEGYTGHIFGGDHTTGSVHVLSGPALRYLTSHLSECVSFFGGHADDLELSRCLTAAEDFARSADKRDRVGKNRFHVYMPDSPAQESLMPSSWYWQDALTCDPRDPRQCAVDFPVTFHYVKPNFMYMLQYSVYHLSAYGTGVKTYGDISS